MVLNRDTNKRYKKPFGIKAANNEWGQLMDTVFVKKGSSKSYTNLITSSAPFEKRTVGTPLASSSSLWESIIETCDPKEEEAVAGVCCGFFYSLSEFLFYFIPTHWAKLFLVTCVFKCICVRFPLRLRSFNVPSALSMNYVVLSHLLSFIKQKKRVSTPQSPNARQ